VKLEVSFHPTGLEPDIRAERVRCRVGEPGSDGAAVLALTLAGACVPSTAQPEAVTFK
jgi:hypothetical protein